MMKLFLRLGQSLHIVLKRVLHRVDQPQLHLSLRGQRCMPLNVVAVVEEGMAKGEGTADILLPQLRLMDVYLKVTSHAVT